MIAFDERVIEAAIFHRAAVDENKLAVPRRARNARRADQTPDADLGCRRFRRRIFPARRFKNFGFFRREIFVQRRGKIHGQKFFVAEQGAEAFAQGFDAAGNGRAGFDGGQLPDDAAILVET